MINYETFKQVELKVAKVIEAERVEGSDKLLKLKIDLGADPSTDSAGASTELSRMSSPRAGSGQERQIIAGVGDKYEPENLVGKNIIVVFNLEPRKLMGLESQGMLLAASNENEGPALLTVMDDIAPGSGIN